jgi:hypothetical protein
VAYRVKAYNTATASKNKIHDDAVARGLGFRGGLVPGVDVYAYLCHRPAERWGRDWLERGTITARFDAPVYDGDEVTVEARPTDDDGIALTLVDPSGATCAVARAGLVDEPTRPDPSAWPAFAAPPEPPAVSADVLTQVPMGSIEATFHSDRAIEYLDDVREGLALFRQSGFAHPGWLLRYANYVLTANVVVGPWIHVESDTQLLGAVSDGDRVETRALVTGVSERGGHRFVDLDVLQVVGDRPVARVAHRAIYQPRGTSPPVSGLAPT